MRRQCDATSRSGPGEFAHPSLSLRSTSPQIGSFVSDCHLTRGDPKATGTALVGNRNGYAIGRHVAPASVKLSALVQRVGLVPKTDSLIRHLSGPVV